MAELILAIIIIGLGYLGFKKITKPKYRIAMTDPITGYVKYLFRIDGINNSFDYTANPDEAMLFLDTVTPARYMKELDKKTSPRIEVKKGFSWKRLERIG
ncbi:hypothetical protein Q2T76_01490 [Lactobacillus sp. YT155]|uniref:hypothetical protein n=1 Tax=Lactobacillus sp. YT155 TaxID=3060955 RepID=UPI00265F061F|nr:hypothetical protein [Lactobacillus sp. YT155]MDO1604724.1 hypothetical protein [Lactobacillus sp. YT155]